jgi:hypothetical protein
MSFEMQFKYLGALGEISKDTRAELRRDFRTLVAARYSSRQILGPVSATKEWILGFILDLLADRDGRAGLETLWHTAQQAAGL